MRRSRTEIKTPQGRSLSVHAAGDADNIPSTTNEDENVVAVQGEEVHPHAESFSKAMDMT